MTNKSRAALAHSRLSYLCLLAVLVMTNESRGDGGSVLARQSIGKETFVLLGNLPELRAGLVDLDLVVEGRESKMIPLKVIFRHAAARENDLIVVADPQTIGKMLLYQLHVELRKAGSWTINIPLPNDEQIEWKIELREAHSIPWQMAVWYLWPFVVVIVYVVREVVVRSRWNNAHRPRSAS